MPVAVILVYAGAKPDSFDVRRSTSIAAPPQAIFALISDFRRFGAWSPYEKLDPEMKRTHSGAAMGRGAVHAWESDGKAGTGRMEIAELSPPSRVAINLDLTKPFGTRNIVELTLDFETGLANLKARAGT